MSIKQTLIQQGSRIGLKLQKHAPTIMTYAGVAGFTVAGILAAKATFKMDNVLDEFVERRETTKQRKEDLGTKEYNKDLAYAYFKFSKDFLKVYWPSISLGVISGALIIGAHHTLNKRNIAIAAAYKALESTFERYRERVVEEIGEDKESDIRRGLVKTVEKYEGEDGKEHQKTEYTFDPTGHSQYARFFDETNPNWQPRSDFNLMFLRSQQSYFNDKLVAQGHVFLNEVYDALGMERSKAGAVVGWVLGKDGDNFIDFGIYNPEDEGSRLFVNGFERSIFLDFNVDGLIYDKI